MAEKVHGSFMSLFTEENVGQAPLLKPLFEERVTEELSQIAVIRDL